MAYQEQQKRYTEISIVNALGKEGRTYNSVVLAKVFVTEDKVETRFTQSGKKVSSFNTPISNRGKLIADKCGIAPQENAEGTCFARVSFWDDTADRFLKFIERHPKCVMTIEGSIKASETESNGKKYVNLEISVSQWTFQRDVSTSGGGSNAPAPAPAHSSASAFDDNPGVPSGSGSQFVDVDDDDEELPF